MKHKNFNEIHPYTYCIKCMKTGTKYYGVRTANVSCGRTPLEDFGTHYFSSGALAEEFKSEPSNYIAIIHYTFDTPKEAMDFEQRFIRKIYKSDQWANNAVNKSINYTPEIRNKMSKVNNEFREEYGMTLGQYRGKKSAEVRRRKGSTQEASIKASRTMSETVAETGETLHEYRVRKGLETRNIPDENGETSLQKAGKKISEHLNNIEENGLTVAQNRFRKFISKLKQQSEQELDMWLKTKNERYQKFIMKSLTKY